MLSGKTFCGVLAAMVAVTATRESDGAFVSAQLVAPTQVAGRWVWGVYLSFSDTNDRLVAVNSFQLTGGSMAGVEHRDYGSGTWNPAWNFNGATTWAGSDSWVSIDGQFLSSTENTVLGWPGGGATIPAGAGWSQQLGTGGGATPYNDPVLAGTAEIKVMQIAGTTLAPGAFAFSFSLNIDWRETQSSAITSSPVSVVIPAPGVAALGALALQFSRRGRRRHQ